MASLYENFLIEEMRQLRSEWEVRTSHEQQLVNYSILLLAGSLTFLGAGPFRDLGVWQSPTVFGLAAIFFCIGFFYLRHDVFIAYTSQYMAGILKPALILGRKTDAVITWEAFLFKRHGRGVKRWLGQLAAVGVCIMPVLIPAAALFGFGIYVLFYHSAAGHSSMLLWQRAVAYAMMGACGCLVVLDAYMCFVCWFERVRTHRIVSRVNRHSEPPRGYRTSKRRRETEVNPR